MEMNPHGEQRSAEWHLWRRGGIGSSDAATIMGCNPYRDIHDLWLEKTGQKEASVFTNHHMQRGIELEPRAREAASAHFERKLFPRELEHPQYNFLRASLDGADLHDEILVEIKCPTMAKHLEFKERGVPDYYVCQIQHQLLVSGIKEAYLFSYVEEEENCSFHAIPVPRDDDFIARMFHREQLFWEHVKDRTPPSDALLGPSDCVENNSAEWVFLAQEYVRLKEQHEYLGTAMERIKQALIAQSKGLKMRGGGVQVSYRQKTTLDRKAISEVLGVDIKEFEVEGRPYAVVEIK